MQVAVIGSGYVGLVSGACFADFGHHVVCVDTDAGKIERLHRGEIPIYEPGLEALVQSNVSAGRLGFVTDAAAAVPQADVVFLAVGTPSRRGDGHADLSYVYAAAADVAKYLRGYTVVVSKSTVPVGTGDEIESIVRRVAPDADFDVASNPEFLREGAAIDDFKRPDRIVVGVENARAEDTLRELYRPLYLNESPLVVTARRTAELTKYAANAFLALKLGFINEIRIDGIRNIGKLNELSIVVAKEWKVTLADLARTVQLQIAGSDIGCLSEPVGIGLKIENIDEAAAVPIATHLVKTIGRITGQRIHVAIGDRFGELQLIPSVG